MKIAKGDWDPAERHPGPDGFGLFLLSGFVVRRVGRAGRFGAELLGPGDLLRPWQTVGPFATTPFEPVWSVVDRAEVALLDGAFARRAAPYPAVAIEARRPGDAALAPPGPGPGDRPAAPRRSPPPLAALAPRRPLGP